MVNPDCNIKKRRVIKSEGRAMIAKVYHFLQDEYQFMKDTNTDYCDLSPLVSVRKRTAEATGVSERTVTKILKEEKQMSLSSTKFMSPLKKRRKRDSKFELDGLHSDVVRTTIQNYHVEHKVFPSLAKLKAEFKEKLDFSGCIRTLRNTLSKMGYDWQKHGDGRKVMQEKQDVRLWRYQYLKQVVQCRSDDHPVVYTGETEVCVKKPGAVIRHIVVHAGTKYGFIPNACLAFQASPITVPNQPKMTHDAYVLWLEDHLLPNLPKKSVIIMDDEPYHRVLTRDVPTHYSSKCDMQKWLSENGIHFDADLHKIELYEMIERHKEKYKTYKIDELIRSKGFEVLRLPPCHPELNAIESVWSVLKSQLDSVTYDKKTQRENVIIENLSKIDCSTWMNACSHVEKLEEEYLNYLDLDVELVAKGDESESESDTDFIEDGDTSPDEISD